MEHPRLYGGKIPVTMYVEKDLFTKIEIQRGKESRNSFLNGIIKGTL